MLAFLYLAMAVGLGDALCRRFLRFGSAIHRWSTAFVVGLVGATWITYIGAALFPRAAQPLLFGNLLFAVTAGALLVLLRGRPAEMLPRPPGRTLWDLAVLAFWTAFTTWLMYNSLSLKDGILYMGGRQWSDFGATLAIVQSFAVGRNFPPQYPHFPGPPLAYHFLFHFEAGNLEWLGLKLHNSFNLLSITSVVAMVGLLMTLGERLFHSRAVGRLAASLFFFHGGLAYVPYFAQKTSWRDAFHSVIEQRDFLESLWPYRSESWGIWTLNIIANQRHLACAIAILLVVLVFLVDVYEWRLSLPKPRRRRDVPPVPAAAAPAPVAPEIAVVDDAAAHGQGATVVSAEAAAVPREAILEPAAEAPLAPSPVAEPAVGDPAMAAAVPSEPVPDPHPAPAPDLEPDPPLPLAPPPIPGETGWRLLASFVFAGFVLGMLPMWNGSVWVTGAVICVGLMVLLPLRVHMFSLLATAAIVGVPQILLSRAGAAVPGTPMQSYPAIWLGYVVDYPTWEKVATYLGFTFGVKWLLLAIALLLVSRLGRSLAIAIFGLVVMTFVVQFSREVAANHKFMFIWEAIVNLYAADVICRLGRRGFVTWMLGVILTLSIVLQGVIDVFPLVHDAKYEHRLEKDRFMTWLLASTDAHDVFLTHRFVTHSILFAGRKIFFGYEYYAWSVGYPVEARSLLYRQMYEERDPATLFGLLRENGIQYVTYDTFLDQSDMHLNLNEDVVRAYGPPVFEDTENFHGGIRVYKVPAADARPTGEIPAARPRPTEPGAAIAGRSRLDRPLGCVVRPSGEILVADAQFNRIVRVTPEGALIDVFGPTGYKEPNAVAVDPAGVVYVADTWNHRVQRLSVDGTPEAILRPPPSGFYAPRDLVLGPAGDLFVANTGQGQIVHYDASGVVSNVWGGIGEAPGQFREPTGLAVGDHEVYVADFANARIQVFSFDGQLARTWPVPEWKEAPRWHRPGLAFYDGVLYASSPVTRAVLAYTSQGEPKAPLTSPELSEPSGLAVSPEGVLFASDPPSGRVVRVAALPAARGASGAAHGARPTTRRVRPR
jgi:hypothetical protein